MMEEYEVVEKFSDDKSPVMIEGCVNDEHEDIIRKYLVEKNDTKVNNKVR